MENENKQRHLHARRAPEELDIKKNAAASSENASVSLKNNISGGAEDFASKKASDFAAENAAKEGSSSESASFTSAASPKESPDSSTESSKESFGKGETAEFLSEMDNELAEFSLNLFGDDEETAEESAVLGDLPTETISISELQRLAKGQLQDGSADTREIPGAFGASAVSAASSKAKAAAAGSAEIAGLDVKAGKIEKSGKIEKTENTGKTIKSGISGKAGNAKHHKMPGKKKQGKPLDAFAARLKVTESPHLHSPDNTRSVMLTVLISLLPILLWGIYSFGLRVLTLTFISVISCVLFEIASQLVFGRKITIADLSAVVTAVITVCIMPASVPLWMPIFCAFISIVLAKQLFGGIGRNVVNPAVLARLIASALFPAQMTSLASISLSPFEISPAFTPVENTPLAILKSGSNPGGSLLSAFFGGGVGCIGEVSAFLIIIAFIFLVCTKTITFHTTLSYIATSAVMFYLFPQLQIASDMLVLTFTGFELFSGSLMFGAVFLATEYGSTPKTHLGKTVFGVLCGALSVVFRFFLPLYDGVCLAILIVSLFSRVIDKWFRPAPYGSYMKKSLEKEALAKKKGSGATIGSGSTGGSGTTSGSGKTGGSGKLGGSIGGSGSAGGSIGGSGPAGGSGSTGGGRSKKQFGTSKAAGSANQAAKIASKKQNGRAF